MPRVGAGLLDADEVEAAEDLDGGLDGGVGVVRVLGVLGGVGGDGGGVGVDDLRDLAAEVVAEGLVGVELVGVEPLVGGGVVGEGRALGGVGEQSVGQVVGETGLDSRSRCRWSMGMRHWRTTGVAMMVRTDAVDDSSSDLFGCGRSVSCEENLVLQTSVCPRGLCRPKPRVSASRVQTQPGQEQGGLAVDAGRVDGRPVAE